MQADHKSVKRKLNIAKGQIEGILKMIDNDEYCIDISNQLLAVIVLLKHANNDILKAHLAHCVKDADKEKLDEKIEEIGSILEKISK